MIKLIASDMDGTLLDEKMTISPATAQAIKTAQARGVVFAIATGRQKKEILPLLEEAGIKAPLITQNGGQVYDKNGKEQFSIAIDATVAKTLINELKQSGLYFEVITNFGVYSDSLTNRITNFAHLLVHNSNSTFDQALIAAQNRPEIKDINFIDNYQRLLDDPTQKIIKFVAFAPDDISQLTKLTQKFAAIDEIVITQSAKTNIEINHKNAQKGIALTKLAQELKVDLKDVMAIGDNNNDVSMLKVAGVSYAMANGSDEVKKIAKYQTKSNQQDGVAFAILQQLKR